MSLLMISHPLSNLEKVILNLYYISLLVMDVRDYVMVLLNSFLMFLIPYKIARCFTTECF